MSTPAPSSGARGVPPTGLPYRYTQLETRDREPALKAMRALAPVLDVRTEELAALVAGADWATSGTSSYASASDVAVGTLSVSDSPSYDKDKVLLSLERRLRDVPPLERIALRNGADRGGGGGAVGGAVTSRAGAVARLCSRMLR